MAIVIQCNLHPYGYGSKPEPIATIKLHTTIDLQHHYIAVGNMKGCSKFLSLTRPKTMSAHRNILHILRDFLNEADIDSLGKDYITASVDRKKSGVEA